MTYTAKQVESHIPCLEARDMHAEAGMLHQYATLLRERESAKAAVTDGWPEYVMLRDTGLHDDAGGLGQRIYTTAGSGYKKRKYILEAAAPILASAQVPDGWQVSTRESDGKTWLRLDTPNGASAALSCGSQTIASQVVRYFVDTLLGAAPKPEKEE